MSNMVIASRLNYCRERNKMTLEEVGKICGVHKSTVSRWEKGETDKISLPILQLLAKHYHVSESWLAGKDTPMTDEDTELAEYLEELKNRSELRMLFKLAKNATKEDVEQAVRIIEAIAKKDE